MKPSKVWYVTGASQGLGLALVKKLLLAGYRVAATSRNAETLKKAVGPAEGFLPMTVDLADTDAIRHSIEETKARFGSIDVLVNNAGYGMAGTLEETTEAEMRKIFDVNVLALFHVTKVLLPVLRQQRRGYIINVGSVAGFVGAPGWSVYSATKAAVAAFTEVLALDLKEFGIKATVVEPSGFRTGFLTESSLAFTEVKIDGYQAVKDTQKRYLAASGNQPGDPDKAAEIFIQLAESDDPPVHLLLGVDAYDRATSKVEGLKEEMIHWQQVTKSADFL
ncbi:MAG TPA: SDR family NAD(P)-dependent oxidoreductase [Puia sp.]|nr:SDR family NAD(P)-dependent oxidoreductase [Puia sp.]